jgi:hypothetical protein
MKQHGQQMPNKPKVKTSSSINTLARLWGIKGYSMSTVLDCEEAKLF